MVVGSVVNTFLETKNIEQTYHVQRSLIAEYEDDMVKYAADEDKPRIRECFESIPKQLAKDNKKFQISKVASGARFKDYRGCIEWLKDAGIVNICYGLHFPELPLKGNYDDNKYKSYLGACIIKSYWCPLSDVIDTGFCEDVQYPNQPTDLEAVFNKDPPLPLSIEKE